MPMIENPWPTIDLHVHLRGTIDRTTALDMARQNKVHVSMGNFSAAGGYAWSSFEEFLTVYDQVGRVVRSAEDIYRLATSYLCRCASQGTIYVEFMLSPGHSVENGIPLKGQLEAMTSAFDEARRSTGIEGGLIITCVRHRGPDEAIFIAETVLTNMSSSVVGFGLTGNEGLYDAAEFKGAFQIAEEAGLGLTAHTGEWRDAASVLQTVEQLNLSRIGHGIRAMENHSIVEKLVERDIGFEVCLSSNVALGACRSAGEHPLRKMIEAGCKVSLATDDPAFFGTSPINEYEIARDVLGISDEQLVQISLDAVDMAFCSPAKKILLREKILNHLHLHHIG
ncbi:adenosine deaminase [Rhizobium leguminosarum]